MVQCLPSHGDTRTVVSFEWRHVSHLSLQENKTKNKTKTNKNWSVLGPMLDVFLWSSRLVHLCEFFFSFSVSRDDGSLGEDISINYVGMKKMNFFLDYSRFGRHSGVESAHPRFFVLFFCPSFSWAGLGVFLCLSSLLPQVFL